MSYTVFARKYRPQNFDDVVGQEHITRTLKNAIQQNRLAHAYIFVGPRGTGKTSTARILAKALNCHGSPGPTLTPCDVCDSCREIAAGNSMDVLEFDAASNTQVDKVREIIIDNVKYLPSRSRFKVYLVDEVHMLSTGSFNALLKTLEEPPPHVKFLFATTDVQKVPATILSRCQRFDLKRIGAPAIASHLMQIAAKEGVSLSDEAAIAVAAGADGGMRDAESMLDQLVAFCGETIEEKDVLSVFGFTSRQTISALCSAILEENASDALRIVHEQAEAGRDLTQLLSDLIGYLRNLLLAQADPASLEAELGRGEVEHLLAQCESANRERLLELIDLCATAEQRMKWASNKQMYLEVALLRAIQAVGQVSLGEVLEALAALREGVPIEVRPPRTPAGSSRPAKVSAQKTPRPPEAVPAAGLNKAAEQGQEATPKVKPQVAAPAPSAVDAPKPQAPAAADPAGNGARPQEVQHQGGPTPGTPTPAPPPVENAPPATVHGALETPAPQAAGSAVDVEKLWPEVVQAVRKERPLISMWLESGVLGEVEAGVARFLFPAEQPLAAEYITQENNRIFLEGLLKRLTGTAVRVVSVMQASVALRPVAQPPPPEKEIPKDPMEDFKNDPLIRKALEIFKARLEAV